MKEQYHIISNTHWDREWYQSHEKYLVRLVSLFDRLLEVMDKEKDYRFITDGQYALLEDYLNIRPEKKDVIKELVASGRLKTGPWYTQPLENIVGGEALIRNLQKGIAESEKLGGAMRFSYEIDEFGHTSQLPQILNGFNIDASMAWRGMPKNTKNVFKWSAPDGSFVYMFYSKSGYGFATGLPLEEEDFDETIDGVTTRRDGLKTCVETLRNYSKEYSEGKNMFWLNGIDHSWAQENLFEVIEKIRKLFPDIEVDQSLPEDLKNAVLTDFEENNISIDEVKGELTYTREDILESTNALHPRQKIRHWKTEHKLVDKIEPLTAFAWLLGDSYPRWAIERAWKYVLENHAHDSLGCCSVDEVYEQVMARYGASLSLAEQCEQNALRYVMSCGGVNPAVYIFNTSSFAVAGPTRLKIEIPSGFGDGYFELYNEKGEKIPHSVISDVYSGDVRYNPEMGHPTWGKKQIADVIIDLPEIPAMGYCRMDYKHIGKDINKLANRREYHFSTAPGVLENEKIKITINPDGTFTMIDKIKLKIYDRQMLFEDTGEAGDVYVHLEPENDKRVIYSSKVDKITQLFDNELGISYRVELKMEIPDGISHDRKYRNEICKTLGISYEITLLKNSGRVDIKIHLDNKSKNHRLRVLFPTYLKDAVCSASGQAFDCVSRPIHEEYDPELPREQAYPTKPMIDYCCIKSDRIGLGIAAKGIYEYECTDDASRSLAVTLLRCIDVIDTKTFAETSEYICHEAQNICEIDFDIALIPFDGKLTNLLNNTSSFVNPVISVMNRQTEDSVMPGYKHPKAVLPYKSSLVDISNKNVIITTFKMAYENDALICRFLNVSDEEQNVHIRFNTDIIKVKNIEVTDLEEKIVSDISYENDLELKVDAHKLVTLKIFTDNN